MIYDRYDALDADTRLDAFLPAYTEIYREPPYLEGPDDVTEFAEHYHVQTRRPGMRLILARAQEEVVGFTYGYHLSPDTRWWTNLQDAGLSPEFTREDGQRTFVIIELAVRTPWRRHGIATELHNRLLQGLDAERVTLTVRPEPEAAPARSAYEAWGYRKLGVSRPFEGAPLYDCMLRERT
ncbi:GNAT family N-acetyltransferase [Streptomyces acidiscabies]|uniref:GNAT family N-acetyltransferase n=1 Tax=Streptomyces acidiscabies TaxID=42234 RepID=A0AAP6BHZ9_9ACTN|nr:GNAT family N-acetyltransferase [Streptomyces acidiscabies]MBP5936487.1 GNAT family N-acetyltransferase [Streptomyces sp. LBUM 1476]MBZ3915537.1 GNAT family N-acetyltransferase [Streptomyces acidiscabies]MDX2965099.1 GNAT family N-acetyltransferase [Streptomyces acidiscabies]MDX3022532.1 GNAT family N-acetyltransferase [Streptomyces acidiscabies]MDX3796122.1 GNAT family N-acetyltransferase [Streptomyces acidiscabies]